jgi:hypothetical protein
VAALNIGQILALIGELAADLSIDTAELSAGALVKVGQIGSIGGKAIYVYLSENASAT